MAQYKRPYSFIEIEKSCGTKLTKIICEETGMQILLDLSDPRNEKTVKILKESMAYEAKLEEQEDLVRSWCHEKRKAGFAKNPDELSDNPDDAFPDYRYTPESQLFPAEKNTQERVEEDVRRIIKERVPKNLKEFFYAHYGEGLSISEIGRRDGVSETARRKYKKRLEKLVKDGLIANHGAFSI